MLGMGHPVTDKPIIPTKVIPAAELLPAPASPPPPPPRPPAPPAVRAPGPDPEWFRIGPVPSGPPPPVPVDVHVTVTIDPGGSLVPADPEPGPRWWGRIRIGYNAGCAFAGFVCCSPWAWVLASIRHDEGLGAAWVAALIPLAVLYLLDNGRQVEADNADPRLIMPRIRAAIARILLWSAVEATALTLPVASIIYALTGVPS